MIKNFMEIFNFLKPRSRKVDAPPTSPRSRLTSGNCATSDLPEVSGEAETEIYLGKPREEAASPPQRNSAADPNPSGCCDPHEPEANWGPGTRPFCAEDAAFLAQVAALTNAYVGKPNDQETREQLSLELTASVTQEPAEASVEPADPAELLPIDSSNPVRPLVNARDLHAFLKVGKDFSTWIKNRIEMAGFVENEDFEVVESLSSPNLGSSKARPQRTKEYLLTMDMAKWIALSANNARGYEARHYFIAWENKMREAYTKLQQQVLDMSDPLVTARLYIEAEEARRAALLEHGRTRLDLQLSEIKNGVLTQRVAEKTKQVDLLADKLSTNEDSCLIEDFARSTGDILGYGRDGLFRYLRRKGFLLRRPANDPSATMVADGYFIKEMNSTFVDHKSGVARQSSTTKLTKAGYDWLLKFMSRDPDTTLNRMLAKPEYKGHAIQCLRSYELYRDGGVAFLALGEKDRPRAIVYSSHATTRSGVTMWTTSRTYLNDVHFGKGTSLEEALLQLTTYKTNQ